MLTIPEIKFHAAVKAAYASTQSFFQQVSYSHGKQATEYTQYVCPPATSPNVGFAIFYTEPKFQPNLLLCGMNPSNFAGVGQPMTSLPNKMMLSWEPPQRNSYRDDKHRFGKNLCELFGQQHDLLADAVGMNVWHFQCVQKAISAPLPLRQFCEETTATLIKAMKPRVVLSLGRTLVDAMGVPLSAIQGCIASKIGRHEGTLVIYLPHPSGSWKAAEARHDFPLVLPFITSELGLPTSSRQDYEPIHNAVRPIQSSKDLTVIQPSRHHKFAHEAACEILNLTKGSCSDEELNRFVLEWASTAGKPLKDTPQQNKNRVLKYRTSWEKHGHCRDMG